MDVLSVRNVYEDAEKAKDKKAPIGADVTIENFTDEDVKVSQGDTKKAGVVQDAVTVVNAMAKLYMTVTVM